jgi:hypothetical protein
MLGAPGREIDALVVVSQQGFPNFEKLATFKEETFGVGSMARPPLLVQAGPGLSANDARWDRCR